MKLRLFLMVFSILFVTGLKAQTGFPFANEVQQFKRADSLNCPKPGGVLFIGSSSIRMWGDLQQRFPDKNIVRRGLGGSQLSEWVKYFAPYVVYPYKPEKIFIYAGENDIAAGQSARDVADSFETFWKMLRDTLPQAQIYFMAIKPSPSRINFQPEFNKANNLIKASVKNKARTHYIDVGAVIMDKTMQPDSSLFRPDYLHLNSQGYDRWQKLLEKYVK